MTNDKVNATPAKKPRATKKPQCINGGSREAQRLAVVILEVLAGVRTPGEAAKVLEITAARYYQLETRALGGLVKALEPRPKPAQRHRKHDRGGQDHKRVGSCDFQALHARQGTAQNAPDDEQRDDEHRAPHPVHG